MAQQTPLHDRHVALGARMVDFAGWEMPLQYSSMREEHGAVREAAGIFDVSHMGEVSIQGREALPLVQRLLASDVGGLDAHQGRYSVMCNAHGGIIDDVIAFRGEDDQHWIVVVNASTRAKDVAWMQRHASGDVTVRDVSDVTALIAVQGPRALAILEPMVALDDGRPLAQVPRFGGGPARLAGVESAEFAHISRTGYTGEDGFEIYVDAESAGSAWDTLLEAGATSGLRPAGLGARDTLRLEAGLRLYGQDMDETTDPYSCGLGWTVKRNKGDFLGRDALLSLDPKKPPRRFLGLKPEGRAIARHGQEILAGGEVVGEVTSGTFSFTLGHSVATASIAADVDQNSALGVRIRDSVVAAARMPLPFYRRSD